MRRYFTEATKGQKIVDIELHDHLGKVFKNSEQEYREAMIGNSFGQTERIGKYLFAELTSGSYLHLHFGMTGNLVVFRGEELPKYTRFVWRFESGDKLAFTDLRKFGVIELVESPKAYQNAHNLGEDLLSIPPKSFAQALANKKVAIKTALLEQKHFAGIGNWIADEVLFNCGVHPKKPCQKISLEKLEEIAQDAKSVVKAAIEADTHYGDFPEHFFANYRKEGILHPAHPKSPVERMVVGGRGTFIVPEKQRL